MAYFRFVLPKSCNLKRRTTPPPQHTCSPPLNQSLLTSPHAPDEFVQSLQTLLRLISKPISVILEHHLPAVSQDSVHTWAQNNPGEQLHQLQIHLLPQCPHPVNKHEILIFLIKIECLSIDDDDDDHYQNPKL